jgi:LacI family transcriptional regulator
VAFANLLLEEPDGSIAGVRQNHDVVGALAVEILAGQLQHKKFGIPKIATTTFVEGTWFDGASCPPRHAVAASNRPAEAVADQAE